VPLIVTLLTDFGDRDGFVGVMKGVILGICPEARLVDLSHQVEPGDVAGGALLLRAAVAYFPPGTIHLAVVDPGVGSERRPIALAAGGHRFVGPDNGLLWPAAAHLAGNDAAPMARLLTNAAYRLPWVSATFHGRDLFAPAAAHLARGVEWESLGPAVTDPVRWEPPSVSRHAAGVAGEVLWIDRYGNAVTNLTPADADTVGPAWVAEIAGARLAPGTHYAGAPPGEPLVLLGSMGTYEIAVNRGSAAERLGLRRGDPVRLLPPRSVEKRVR
jgi:S-adenosylmethionine hydrolase